MFETVTPTRNAAFLGTRMYANVRERVPIMKHFIKEKIVAFLIL